MPVVSGRMSEAWAGDVPLLREVALRADQRLVPLHVSLEVTYRCNLHCKHCYVDRDLRDHPSDELSVAEWCGILDQLASAGALYLLLTGGEVFLRPDFLEIALAARERGFQFAILTNGTLVTPSIIDGLKEIRPHFVGISLYGATVSTHEAVTGCPGSFVATSEAISGLVAEGIQVVVQTTLMEDNIHEVEAIRDLVCRMGASLSLGYQIAPTKGCSPGPQQFEASFEAIACHLGESPGLALPGQATGPETCRAGRALCAVSPYGDVSPCLMMPLRLGNLRERGFSDIWRENPCDDLLYLRSLTGEDIEGCADCPEAAFCQRCPGAALAETGSLTGRQPSACRYAAIRARLYRGIGGEVRL